MQVTNLVPISFRFCSFHQFAVICFVVPVVVLCVARACQVLLVIFPLHLWLFGFILSNFHNTARFPSGVMGFFSLTFPCSSGCSDCTSTGIGNCFDLQDRILFRRLLVSSVVNHCCPTVVTMAWVF